MGMWYIYYLGCACGVRLCSLLELLNTVKDLFIRTVFIKSTFLKDSSTRTVFNRSNNIWSFGPTILYATIQTKTSKKKNVAVPK